MRTNNQIEYYSDATQDILLKFINDEGKIDNFNLEQIDELIRNKKIPFKKR